MLARQRHIVASNASFRDYGRELAWVPRRQATFNAGRAATQRREVRHALSQPHFWHECLHDDAAWPARKLRAGIYILNSLSCERRLLAR